MGRPKMPANSARSASEPTGGSAISLCSSTRIGASELEKDGHDHLISPEERFRVAMLRQ